MTLYPLLDYLSTRPPDMHWQGWEIRRVSGGHNNLLYHARGPGGNLAVKWTRRDDRDRAGRECAALQLLRRRAMHLAPEALLVDRERYDLPVVVQTWLDGIAGSAPPESDGQWHALLEHYVAIHTIHQAPSEHDIRPAFVNFASADDGLRRARSSAERVPAEAWTAALTRHRERMETYSWPVWHTPRLAFCRADPNVTNFVRSSPGLYSVDWENSGWGDPAFEIGDMLAHPAYLDVTDRRRAWVMRRYAEIAGADQIAVRSWVYFCLMCCDWAFFFARKAHEHAADVARKARLVDRPAEWYHGLPRQRDRYMALARRLLDGDPLLDIGVRV